MTTKSLLRINQYSPILTRRRQEGRPRPCRPLVANLLQLLLSSVVIYYYHLSYREPWYRCRNLIAIGRHHHIMLSRFSVELIIHVCCNCNPSPSCLHRPDTSQPVDISSLVLRCCRHKEYLWVWHYSCNVKNKNVSLRHSSFTVENLEKKISQKLAPQIIFPNFTSKLIVHAEYYQC